MQSAEAGSGGCCKHVAAVLYQLVDYKESATKSVPDDKTCTDILQQWHVTGEGKNINPIKFTDLTFEKADANKDKNNSRKRPIVTGKRNFCATPMFAKQPESAKIKKLSDDLLSSGQDCVFANLLKANSYKPCFFFTTSIDQSEKQDIPISITQLSQSLSIDIIMGFSDSPAIHKSNSGQIERSTVSQAATPKWFEERKKRLTASNFGSVLNRRKNIYPASLLQKVFGCLTFYSEACQWGKNQRGYCY